MFLGIEIGGTKLQLGIGPGDGTIVALERANVDATAGAEHIRQQIIELVPVLLARSGLSHADIRAVGIGFGGPVDAERGVVTKSHQIEGWGEFPLADWSRRELGWPTVVHNDADTAGLAEACFGAGRGYSPIFYITIGSGIGGGLIIDQKIYRGAGAGAGEIGHLKLEPDRWGENATVESIASGWGMTQQARQRLEYMEQGLTSFRDYFHKAQAIDAKYAVAETRIGTELHNSKCSVLAQLSDRESITVPMIVDASQQGDKIAAAVLESAIEALAWALGHVIALLCPRRIVVGGGVSLIGEDLLFNPLRQRVSALAFKPFADLFEIVPAALGETVVVHGALRLAKVSSTSEIV